MLVVLLSLNSNYVDIPFFVLLCLVVFPCDEVDTRVYSPDELVHSGSMLPLTPRLRTGKLHADMQARYMSLISWTLQSGREQLLLFQM